MQILQILGVEIVEKTKEISILFTRYSDFFSRFVYWISGRGFTHVSIALDNNQDYFYSFNTKGFKKEYPRKHKNRTKESLCYKLMVTEEEYEKLCKVVDVFMKKKEQTSYNWVGIVLCFIGIPIFLENKFFCSQWVAFALEIAGICLFTKNVSKYLPSQLKKELDERCLVVERIVNPEFLTA